MPEVLACKSFSFPRSERGFINQLIVKEDFYEKDV
jgi:hypothetical protein